MYFSILCTNFPRFLDESYPGWIMFEFCDISGTASQILSDSQSMSNIFLLWMYFMMFFLWVFTICFFWKMIGPDEVQWQRIFGMLVCMDEEVWAPMWFMKVNKRPVSRGFRWVLTFSHVQTAVLFAGKLVQNVAPHLQWRVAWRRRVQDNGLKFEVHEDPAASVLLSSIRLAKRGEKGQSNAGCGEGVSVLCYSIRFFPVGNWKVIFWSRGCDTCRSRRDFVPVSKILGIQAASQAQLQATPSGILDPHRTQPTQM